MVLHLLGKKSWNVYNTENVARVRRDEAQAKLQEEEEERRMQEVDAERRIQILRGERPSTPPPPPPSKLSASRASRGGHRDATGIPRKRRRLAGENDTDRDIRIAREDAQLAVAKREELTLSRIRDAPIQDSSGNINLFPPEEKPKHAEKNPEAEKALADKRQSFEDQYTMRFSNAAGFRQSVGKNPWYSSSQANGMAPESISSTNVWGNEDPMRKEREKARIDSNDPLMEMKRGVRQLKTVEEERKKWNQERNRELEALKSNERARSRRRRRTSPSENSLEGFKLDASPEPEIQEKDRRPHRHRQRSRDRIKSRSHRKHSSSRSYAHSSRHHHQHRDRSKEGQPLKKDIDPRHSRRK